MQKIKLFMMLALLMAGVSESWAVTTKYTVVWDETLPGAGYSLGKTTASHYWQSYGYTASFSITGGDGTSEVTVEETDAYDMFYIFNYNWADIKEYFVPNTIPGYATDVWINSTDRKIYIGYTYSGSDVITWTDGDLEYSNVYTSSSYSTRKLPEGEVAVRLALKDKTTVTDTIAIVQIPMAMSIMVTMIDFTLVMLGG